MKEKKPLLAQTPVVIGLAVLCNALWGSAIPFINLGYKLFDIPSGETATQILFAGCRFFLAGALTILFASIQRRTLVHPKRKNLHMVVKLGMLQTVAQYVLFYIGVARTTSVKGAIIQGLNAFVAILIACYIFRSERMNRMKWIGGAVMAAAGLLLGGRLHPAGIGAPAVLLYLAALSAVAYTVWALLLKYNPVSRIAPYMFLQPLFGVLLSLLLYGGENVPLLRYGAALVLVCLSIVIIGKGQQEKA